MKGSSASFQTTKLFVHICLLGIGEAKTGSEHDWKLLFFYLEIDMSWSEIAMARLYLMSSFTEQLKNLASNQCFWWQEQENYVQNKLRMQKLLLATQWGFSFIVCRYWDIYSHTGYVRNLNIYSAGSLLETPSWTNAVLSSRLALYPSWRLRFSDNIEIVETFRFTVR